MKSTLIRNCTVVFADRLAVGHSVLCQDGKIARVGKTEELSDAKADSVVDADGRYLAPGFIDMHIHGTHEFLIDKGVDELAAICELLPRYGVTSFLPTVCPRRPGEDVEFVQTLSKIESRGTRILGFHHEGPFLTMTGALPKEALGDADPDRVRALMEATRPYKAVFSISPDFEGILDLLPIMTEGGCPAFITHTAATAEQTWAAIDAGARHATHFYDVFPAPEESDPGVRHAAAVEAILADDRATVDFILDGEHVNPVAVKVALKCKGDGAVCLITDANVGAGLGPGKYQFMPGTEVEFTYDGGPARMTDKSEKPGVLAGSGLTLDRAMRNAIKLLDASIPQAIRMVSANPAKVLGVDASKGVIQEGCDADLVLLTQDLEVETTWIGGVEMKGSSDD